LRPEFTDSSNRFLEYRGAGSVVAGDTTVAYTGPRGHRQNPDNNAGSYLDLAREHGWSIEGPADVPFVVLDRPLTAIQDRYEFTNDQICTKIGGIQRFRDFFPAGGFAAADFMINHAHLTLHGLAGLAGCIKSIAMGCSGLSGKLRMHQSLLPIFERSLCKHCGLCIENCPEDALSDPGNDMEISVDCNRCIGCGECVSLCKNKAVKLRGNEISNWTLGEETLPVRMADYTIGLMNGYWDRAVHVLHMYSITELCDCVNQKQQPFINDIGFLIGKNPFAVDRVAAGLLAREAERKNIAINQDKLKAVYVIADYVQQNYGIVSTAPFYPLYCHNFIGGDV
jgi:ferredoxin